MTLVCLKKLANIFLKSYFSFESRSIDSCLLDILQHCDIRTDVPWIDVYEGMCDKVWIDAL